MFNLLASGLLLSSLIIVAMDEPSEFSLFTPEPISTPGFLSLSSSSSSTTDEEIAPNKAKQFFHEGVRMLVMQSANQASGFRQRQILSVRVNAIIFPFPNDRLARITITVEGNDEPTKIMVVTPVD